VPFADPAHTDHRTLDHSHCSPFDGLFSSAARWIAQRAVHQAQYAAPDFVTSTARAQTKARGPCKESPMTPLKAGYSRADITPPVGVRLNGFAARLGESTGVDSPLFASTLFITDGQTTAVIAALDLLGIPHAEAESLTRELADIARCDPGQVILASSHTHSGPMSMPIRGLGGTDAKIIAIVRRGLIESCRRAIARARPVSAAWGKSPIAFGRNRRQKSAAGITLGHRPEGPHDTQVTALFLAGDEPGQRPIALYAHACHPYSLSAGSTLISADFCGHANDALLASGFDPLFINGCAGDIAPPHADATSATAIADGRRLATCVLDAFEKREPTEPSLFCASKWIDLPHAPMPPIAQLRAQCAAEQQARRNNASLDPRLAQRIADAQTQWLADLTAITGGTQNLPPVPARASLLRLGSGGIAALPGEIFFETGQTIARRIDAQYFIPSCFCHGYTGYAPTPQAHREGGYEVNEAHQYLMLWKLDETVPVLLENTVASIR
jgi:hypothetical protein